MSNLEELQKKISDCMKVTDELKNQLAAKQVQNNIYPQIPLPKPINLRGDVLENCKNFKQTWENYTKATGLEHQNEQTKIAVLLTAIGEDVFKIYLNMPLLLSDKSSAKSLLEAIEKNLTPSVNKRYARALFNNATQNEEESYDEYFNRLRGLLKNTQYGDLADEILLDKIICSIKDKSLKEKLWLDENITLNKAIEICRSKETTEKQLRGIEGNSQREVNKIQKALQINNKKRRTNEKQTNNKTCNFCGNNYHENLNQCPARKATCKYCNKKGHFEKVCLTKKININNKNNRNNKNKTVKQVTTTLNVSGLEQEEYVLTVTEHNGGVFAFLNIYNKYSQRYNIKCQLDTGASCNIIGYENLKQIEKHPNIKQTSTKLKTFDGSTITPVGATTLTVEGKGKKYELDFHVVNITHCPLLSAKACQQLKLIEICKCVEETSEKEIAKSITEKYPDVFEGLGKLEGKISLEIDKSITPKTEPPRRIPVAMRQQLQATLTEMEKENVITKEHEHTEWTNNIVIVKKNNKMRICIDPKNLNKALKDVKYQLPTFEEVLSELKDAKIFTTLDAKHGFWQLELDEESSKFTSFWTPFGKYRFKRLPFGIKPAMEIYQMRQNQIIAGLKGVVCIADDILVFGRGKNKQEALIDHNINLEQLLKRLRKENLKINKNKIKLCEEKVKFYGHILTSKGIQPNPDIISAILNMTKPKDKKDVTRFLGLITYISKFLPELSNVAEPLRRITHINSEYSWNID